MNTLVITSMLDLKMITFSNWVASNQKNDIKKKNDSIQKL